MSVTFHWFASLHPVPHGGEQIHNFVPRFDDAYFLEPEAAASASKTDAPDATNTNVSVVRGGLGGDKKGGDGGDQEDIAKITAMAAAVPGLPLGGADGGTSCGGSGAGVASREGAAASREEKSCPQKQGDGDRVR